MKTAFGSLPPLPHMQEEPQEEEPTGPREVVLVTEAASPIGEVWETTAPYTLLRCV